MLKNTLKQLKNSNNMEKILLNIALNLIGIGIYFINRYIGRQAKGKFSWSFWLKDNLPEFISTMLMNIALMILIHLPETSVSLDKLMTWLPFDLHLAGLPTLSFLLGLGLTSVFYQLFRNKTKLKKENGN